MEKESASSKSNVKVQDILKIFENGSENSVDSQINANENPAVSVNIYTWSLRRRIKDENVVKKKVVNGSGVDQPKRVCEMVQHFQGKQLPPVATNTNDDANNGKNCTNNQTLELPKGPPPQKPNRTFEHDIYLKSKGLLRGQSVDGHRKSKPTLPPRPLRSKTAPVMSNINPTKSDGDSGEGSSDVGNDATDVTDTAAVSAAKVSGRMRHHRPRTPPPPRPPNISFKNGNSNGNIQYGCLKKCFSAERIYDEPWCSTWEEMRKKKSKTVLSSQLVDNEIYSGDCQPHVNNQNNSANSTGELFYMSSPLFSMGKATFDGFPRPLTTAFTRQQSEKVGFTRKVNYVDEDVLNWSFMSIYGQGNKTVDGVTTRDSIDSSDSDNEITEKELQKRIERLHKVNRNPSIRLDPKDHRLAYRKQFDAVLIVGLRFEGNDSSVYQPYVKNIFPNEDCLTAAARDDVAHFCFPDAELWKPASARETYTFVLTNEKGDRLYGYCRRVKPDGVEYNIPVVYCILSPVLDRAYYSQLLREIEKRHGLPEMKMKCFVQTLYNRAIPLPGKTTVIRRSSLDGDCQVALCRSNEYYGDHYDTSRLLSQLSISVLLKVFSSFLLERRVLFCASQPETLTETIHSLVSLLHPFQWPHTFIPILPNKLLEVVASPTPYIIGILSHSRQQLDNISVDDDAIMVDLDSGLIVREVGDETTIIPKKVYKALSTALKLIRHRTGNEDDEDEGYSPGSTLVAEAFLRMFIELVGHYQQHITLSPDGKKTFDRESFCMAPLSRGMQMFLKWFTQTQIFDMFIEAATSNNHQNGVFEERIGDRQLDTKPTLKYNVKEFSKKMKTFGEKLIGLKAITSPKS
ncbi:DENN MADD domain containing [Chamberlinius hualienensis]